jgi:nitrile hydratase
VHESYESELGGCQRVADGSVTTAGVPAEHSFLGEPNASQRFTALGELEIFRKNLDDIRTAPLVQDLIGPPEEVGESLAILAVADRPVGAAWILDEALYGAAPALQRMAHVRPLILPAGHHCRVYPTGSETTNVPLKPAAKSDTLARMHDSDHDHDDAHKAVPSDLALRVTALESLLIEKGLVDTAALDALVETYEHKIGPRNGAKVIARAWTDSSYKGRLLTDATAAIAELGFGGLQGEHMVAVENTRTVHNLVVCTLCSCYPYTVLGLPPVWYKSAPYRSRAVIDPRGVLREFGLELPLDTEIRVWDSTAEVRYLVLPERPVGTENLSQEQLAALVTRDAMIGVSLVHVSAPQDTP